MSDGDTRRIALSQGFEAIVDAEDFEWLNQWKWTLMDKRNGLLYAYRLENGHSIRLHRFIMGAPSGTEIDHIDHDGLNNQRSNLRLCTHQQNMWHNARGPWGRSGYWGVYFESLTGKWSAQIGANYHVIHIGRFDNPVDAARAYDAAARKYHGEYAKQNFPEEAPACQAQ